MTISRTCSSQSATSLCLCLTTQYTVLKRKVVVQRVQVDIVQPSDDRVQRHLDILQLLVTVQPGIQSEVNILQWVGVALLSVYNDLLRWLLVLVWQLVWESFLSRSGLRSRHYNFIIFLQVLGRADYFPLVLAKEPGESHFGV